MILWSFPLIITTTCISIHYFGVGKTPKLPSWDRGSADCLGSRFNEWVRQCQTTDVRAKFTVVFWAHDPIPCGNRVLYSIYHAYSPVRPRPSFLSHFTFYLLFIFSGLVGRNQRYKFIRFNLLGKLTLLDPDQVLSRGTWPWSQINPSNTHSSRKDIDGRLGPGSTTWPDAALKTAHPYSTYTSFDARRFQDLMNQHK